MTQLQIQCDIFAPIEKIWEAIHDPKHVIHWNFAWDDWHCPQSKDDFQVGWTFCNTMAAKDGSMSFDFEWEYTKIISYQNIQYTILDMQYGEKYLEKGRKVSLEFIPEKNFVRVIESFDAEDIHPLELQIQWWQAILNHFKAYCENTLSDKK